MPGPVMRMAPKPRRLTVMSPMVKRPDAAALGVLMVLVLSDAGSLGFLQNSGRGTRKGRARPKTFSRVADTVL
jgi:hypothetical protein